VNTEFYKKLVDLYAGRELPRELDEEMEMAAFGNQELSHDMSTLRKTIDMVHAEPVPEFSEESYQRILIRLYASGIDPNPKSPTPSHFQYQLPIQG
jgi:hypothetical protein